MSRIDFDRVTQHLENGVVRAATHPRLPPAAPGDVIPVEIVVVGLPGERYISWREGETAQQQVEWGAKHKMPHNCTIRAVLPSPVTVPVVVGELSPAVLPDVTASE